MSGYPQQSLQRNDRKAGWVIGIFSFVVFAVVASLSKIHLHADPGFDVHIFALVNAVINSLVSVLLVAGLVLARRKKYIPHKKVMMAAMILSVLFLVSYITHHLLSGDTVYGDADHNGILDESEKAAVAGTRMFYLVILIAHIFLAAIILPFILYTAYRGLTSEYPRHRKLGKITWPIWFYVSLSGPVLYWMISPYYY